MKLGFSILFRYEDVNIQSILKGIQRGIFVGTLKTIVRAHFKMPTSGFLILAKTWKTDSYTHQVLEKRIWFSLPNFIMKL